MKKTMSILLSAMMTTSVMAQQNQQNGNQNNGQQQNNSYGVSCLPNLQANKEARKDPKVKVPLSTCEQFNVIASLNNEPIDQSDSAVTMDGKIPCKQNGGYTVDYNDCTRVMNLYNGVMLAEQGMFAAQTIKVNEANIEQNKKIAEAAAKGDTQYGAIEAVMARNVMNAKINQTQAKTYKLAVLALGAEIAVWQRKKSIGKLCEKKPEVVKAAGAEMGYDLSVEECQAIAEKYKTSNLVFHNNNSKARFVTELGVLIQKATDAMKRAGIAEEVADRMKDTVAVGDEENTVFDPCISNPTPECKKNGPRNLSTGTFKGNTIDFGNGVGGNQDFNFDPNGPGIIGDDGVVGGAETEKVADMASPFESAAKEASGILDPAAAASMTPGSAGAGAAGGGGGGGGGGGSASLGDDLAGATAEDSGDPDIKSNKVSGKYKTGKGGGFQAVKAGKEDSNPFASMFDAKGDAGGIEEDRSIASDDGEASGLFHKISKKYGQVQQDKRLENLE